MKTITFPKYAKNVVVATVIRLEEVCSLKAGLLGAQTWNFDEVTRECLVSLWDVEGVPGEFSLSDLAWCLFLGKFEFAA